MNKNIQKLPQNSTGTQTTGMQNLKMIVDKILPLVKKHWKWLIPTGITVLGVSYQLIALLDVGLKYLPKFSFSQVTPDGLTFGLFLAISIFILLLVIFYIDLVESWIHRRSKGKVWSKHLYTMIAIFYSWVLLWSLLWGSFLVIKNVTPLKSDWVDIGFITFIAPLFCIPPIYFFMLWLRKALDKLWDRYIPTRPVSRFQIKIVLSTFCFVSYCMLTMGAYGILNTPSDSLNIDYLICQESKENPNTKIAYKYANDTHVFLTLHDANDNEKVLYRGIEQLQNAQPCQ